MNREQELEQKLKDYKETKNRLFDKLENSSKIPDKQKAVMWDTLLPFIRRSVEDKINKGSWNFNELTKIISEKALQCVCGEEVFSDLDKV